MQKHVSKGHIFNISHGDARQETIFCILPSGRLKKKSKGEKKNPPSKCFTHCNVNRVVSQNTCSYFRDCFIINYFFERAKQIKYFVIFESRQYVSWSRIMFEMVDNYSI